MNKKQVGALLKIISKDDMRPVLNLLKIDMYNDKPCIVGTNGYVLACLYVDDDVLPIMGKTIRRIVLERWYKLAVGKSRLVGSELVHLYNEDYTENGEQKLTYPDWHKVTPPDIRKGSSEISFNAEYPALCQVVDESDGLVWNIGAKWEAMQAITDKGMYIVMPIYTKDNRGTV